MLTVDKIQFSYLDETTIHTSSFIVKKSQSLAIIGESGCGKSTLLKLMYGLHDLDRGKIFWNEIPVLGPKYNLIPGMEFMKYLAQDFDLMPFITVAENVGKFLSNVDYDKKQNRIQELLEVVEMSEFANIKAKYLSGGQMQRVALARVLALEPEVLLLDEPFSHIDNFRKNSLRRKLFSYFKQKQITTIIATHDSTDVLSFADEVLVMQSGKIIENGTPKSIYTNPKNKYIASLFGDVNELKINEVLDYIYPHQLKIIDESDIKVEILNSYFRGSHYLIEAKYNNQILFFENSEALIANSEVFLKITDL